MRVLQEFNENLLPDIFLVPGISWRIFKNLFQLFKHYFFINNNLIK